MILIPATTPNSFQMALLVSANTPNPIAAAILQNRVTMPILLIISYSAFRFLTRFPEMNYGIYSENKYNSECRSRRSAVESVH